ncbi:hypothetical protein F4553_000901 [Allocatelliglobosispora scoriae]|uniref:Uncharacterized protein n=1 Tax=Allocatelliglobosispora scoriae TaxID=643052 RepID=A0A841BLA0_9ACTN|nr:hypothetical protein [Allocatelliglobosispora scoriae]MBB5867522.1 hypothetical protein [Allocatelliglobosispora scoriae]
MTGILHAVVVDDGRFLARLYPDDGGPPILLAFTTGTAAAVRGHLCDIVTACGVVRQHPDGSERLELHHVGVCGDQLARPASVPPGRAAPR